MRERGDDVGERAIGRRIGSGRAGVGAIEASAQPRDGVGACRRRGRPRRRPGGRRRRAPMAGSRTRARQQQRGGVEASASRRAAARGSCARCRQVGVTAPSGAGNGHRAPPSRGRGRRRARPAARRRDGCRRRPDRGLSTSSLRLCGRNQALCVRTGSSPNAAPRNDEQPVLEVLRRQHPRGDDLRLRARAARCRSRWRAIRCR